jgi:hypothetical protein
MEAFKAQMILRTLRTTGALEFEAYNERFHIS